MARKKKERKGQEQGFEPDGTPTRQRLTPVEIQQKVFRLAFRGYNERDVDQFLDNVTEDLAALHEENKRLREQLQEGGGGGTDAAQRRAEAIVREAREHAARLVEEAERRGAIGAVPGPVPASFLVRERDFLQRLASLVQGHARTLKEDARRGRSAKPAEGPAASEPPASEVQRQTAATSSSGPATATEGAPEPSPVIAVGEPAELADVPDEPSPDTDLDQGARPEMSGAEGPRDASAAWGSAGESPEEAGPTPTSSPWTGERAPGTEEPSKDDPLLAAWESAFLGPEGQSPQGAQRPKDDQKEGEPSLRELFWGEE